MSRKLKTSTGTNKNVGEDLPRAMKHNKSAWAWTFSHCPMPYPSRTHKCSKFKIDPKHEKMLKAKNTSLSNLLC